MVAVCRRGQRGWVTGSVGVELVINLSFASRCEEKDECMPHVGRGERRARDARDQGKPDSTDCTQLSPQQLRTAHTVIASLQRVRASQESRWIRRAGDEDSCRRGVAEGRPWGGPASAGHSWPKGKEAARAHEESRKQQHSDSDKESVGEGTASGFDLDSCALDRSPRSCCYALPLQGCWLPL